MAFPPDHEFDPPSLVWIPPHRKDKDPKLWHLAHLGARLVLCRSENSPAYLGSFEFERWPDTVHEVCSPCARAAAQIQVNLTAKRLSHLQK